MILLGGITFFCDQVLNAKRNSCSKNCVFFHFGVNSFFAFGLYVRFDTLLIFFTHFNPFYSFFILEYKVSHIKHTGISPYIHINFVCHALEYIVSHIKDTDISTYIHIKFVFNIQKCHKNKTFIFYRIIFGLFQTF